MQVNFMAWLQLERIQRYEGEELVKDEVIQELEKEYDTTQRLLAELETSAEAKRRREIQTLRRFGVMDANIRYSLPEIEISYTSPDPSVVNNPQLIDSEPDAEEEENLSDFKSNKSIKATRSSWKGLGWLTGSPLFRRRSGSESSGNRKYRAISADVVALPSTTVQNLRRLYTGRSEFYDIEDEESAEPNKQENKNENDSSKQEIISKNISSQTIEESNPIDPTAMAEIVRFETLIKDYFRKKQRKRY